MLARRGTQARALARRASERRGLHRPIGTDTDRAPGTRRRPRRSPPVHSILPVPRPASPSSIRPARSRPSAGPCARSRSCVTASPWPTCASSPMTGTTRPSTTCLPGPASSECRYDRPVGPSCAGPRVVSAVMCSTWTARCTWATSCCRARRRPSRRSAKRGGRVAFLTNKPLESPATYAAKLTELGIPADGERGRVVDRCAAALPRRTTPRVHGSSRSPSRCSSSCCATPVSTLRSPSDDPTTADLVVVSWDRTFDYAKLLAAFRAVRAGARIVATNPDPFCPTPDGDLPDCAAMLAAIEASTGARPKPSSASRPAHGRDPARPPRAAAVGHRPGRRSTHAPMSAWRTRLGWPRRSCSAGRPSRRRSRTRRSSPDFVLAGVAEILPRDRLEEVS